MIVQFGSLLGLLWRFLRRWFDSGHDAQQDALYHRHTGRTRL